MLRILDPVQEPLDSAQGLAPRLATLEGKRLGLYNNDKLNSVRLLELVAEELARDARFQVQTGSYAAFRVMEPDEWPDVTRCDAVILANGDCGACSSSGIANAIELEKRGIPSFLISTPPFRDAVGTLAAAGGMADLRWGVVEHPIGSVGEAELRERARQAAEQFRQIVLAPQAAEGRGADGLSARKSA